MRRPRSTAFANSFHLSVFEREVVLLCAGVEMDLRLAARCGAAQGYPQRTYATFGLAPAALAEPHWSALTPSRPLRRFRLVEVEPGHGLTTAPLRIDERILHYLAGVNAPDPRLHSMIQLSPFPDWVAEEHQIVSAPGSAVLLPIGPRKILPSSTFAATTPTARKIAATLAVLETGRHLFTVRAEDLPVNGTDLDQFTL